VAKQAFLQKVWNKVVYNPDYKRGITFADADARQAWNTFLGVSDSDAGEKVTVQSGSQIDTVFSCFNAYAQDISKLPFNVRQKVGENRIVVQDNEVQYLLNKRPNEYTSASNFRYNIVFNMFSYGNAYAIIKRGSNLKAESLHIAHPNEVEPMIVEGEVFYQYKTLAVKAEDMLHFKIYSFDGLLGVSPIIWCANTIGYRLKMNKYTAKVLGSKPEGLLTFDQALNAEQMKESQKMWTSMVQEDGLGGTAVLGAGAKYLPFALNPDVVQMIESTNLSDERLMGILRTPPTVIQKYSDSAFKGPEQQDTVWLKYSITPILKIIEQECDYKLFPEANKRSLTPLYTKHNIKEMLRGSIREQGEWYRLMVSIGAFSINDVLEMEDRMAVEGGDLRVVQSGFIPINKLEEFYSSKSASTGNDDLRKMGFDLDYLKQAIERQEILNAHE